MYPKTAIENCLVEQEHLAMNMKQIIAVTNRLFVDGDPMKKIEVIAAAGPQAVILREKDLPGEVYLQMAQRAQEICRRYGVVLFVHSHPDIADEIECSALHLSIPGLRAYLKERAGQDNWKRAGQDNRERAGQENRAEQPALRSLTGTENASYGVKPDILNSGLQGRFKKLSVSCHSLTDVEEAVSGGATQIVLGNIFETDCKKGLPGKGLDFLEEIVQASPVPVFGIGGITPENLGAVLQTGAAGGCMMSWWYR